MPLGRVYQFKYLGVILDPSLTWNDHIDYIASKISARLGMLRKAPKVIPGAPAYLLNQFSFSRDYHCYNTRHKDLIRMPLAKTSKFQSYFKYSGAREWNSLPSYLRQESSLSLFKKNLKRHLCD